jgi:hypothetical protein
MTMRGGGWLAGVGLALAFVLLLCRCTPGGQFDPTELMSTDIFSTKKQIQGQREPLFPEGVPGAQSGVPPDLVKGYQPPPEPAAATGEAQVKAAAAAEPAKQKPKPKAKPKAVARATVGDSHKKRETQSRSPATPQAASARTNWPASQPPSAQTNWPAPGQVQQGATPQAQTNWPAPPPVGEMRAGPPQVQTNWPPPPSTAQGQQAGQPGQAASPNPSQ